METYKEIERQHYDRKAIGRPRDDLLVHGAGSVDVALRSPYRAYEAAVRAHSPAGGVVLDIGAGDGVHSLLAREAAVRIPVDIALAPLARAAVRGEQNGVQLLPVAADAEQLPLRPDSVDVVTSAGALYCLSFSAIIEEVCRVLKQDGTWIFVDSFDHNPFYRLNRRVGRIRGRRTRRAVENIPNMRFLADVERAFDSVMVRYFGVFAFLAPVLRRFLGPARTARTLDRLDAAMPGLQRFAFKIVVVAARPRQQGDGR